MPTTADGTTRDPQGPASLAKRDDDRRARDALFIRHLVACELARDLPCDACGWSPAVQ